MDIAVEFWLRRGVTSVSLGTIICGFSRNGHTEAVQVFVNKLTVAMERMHMSKA